jgi:hypothetical protein
VSNEYFAGMSPKPRRDLQRHIELTVSDRQRLAENATSNRALMKALTTQSTKTRVLAEMSLREVMFPRNPRLAFEAASREA